MKNNKIEINKNYYDTTYNTSLIVSALKLFFSFDQAYKAKYIKYYLNKEERFLTAKNVFDYGMGNGALLLRIPIDNLNGYDISNIAIENFKGLQKYLKRNATFTKHKLEYSDKKFDIVIASHVLEHIPDYRSKLDSLYRSTAKDGLLVIVLPINEVIDDPKHCHSFYDEDILNKFANYGDLKIFKYDALTNLILHLEYNKNHRIFGKLLRYIFGLLPFRLVRIIDWILLKRYKPSQILILIEK